MSLIPATIILRRTPGATVAWAEALPVGTRPPATAPAVASKRFLRFQESDTTYGLLRRHGFSETQIQQAMRQNLLTKGFSLAHGESYRLGVSLNRKLVELRIYEPTKDMIYAFWRYNDSAGAYTQIQEFTVKNRRIEGTINGSLLTSILEKLPNKWAAHRFLDAYSLDYNVPRKLQRGARFAFVIETKWEGADMIGYGELLQTELEIEGAREKRFFVSFSKGGSFINPKNLQIERPLFAPVNYVRLSSLFETRRFHPIKHRRQPHLGIDFEIHQGEDVYAAESGTIEAAGYKRAAGNYVIIRHDQGLTSYYNHLLAVDSAIVAGAKVLNGQKIGAVGCTGYCTKAHLHFALKQNGKWVDPARFIKSYPFKTQSLISDQSDVLRSKANL